MGFSGVTLHERDIIPVGDEADVLAVPFPGIDEAILLRNGTHLILGQLTKGEENVGQLVLIQAGQEIGLILGKIRCFI